MTRSGNLLAGGRGPIRTAGAQLASDRAAIRAHTRSATVVISRDTSATANAASWPMVPASNAVNTSSRTPPPAGARMNRKPQIQARV